MKDQLIDQFADKAEHGGTVRPIAGAATADGDRIESGAYEA
jgi:hypothetical protein